jgi:hypothetical protein
VVRGAVLGVASCAALLAACTGTSSGNDSAPTGTPGAFESSQGFESGQVSGPASGGTIRPAPTTGTASSSTGWTVTVYYTAVASLHRGTAEKVTGCLKLDCTNGKDNLGSYPSDFVKAVKDEGAGKISAGKYLNWSYDTGYWLDTAARDTAGRPLVPFSSAAADRDVMKAGTRFTISQCGKDDDGQTIDADVCTKLKSSRWTITDEFTPGLGGSHHVDAYIGEETGPDFVDSAWYTTLHKATLSISR